MPSISIQITDEDLISKIQTSYLEDQQKKDLTGLVGDMTQGERGDLIAMIDKTNDEIADSDKKYAEDVKNLVREETTNARKEYEKLDNTENEKEMEMLDEELDGTVVDNNQNLNTEMDPRLREDDKNKPKKHTIFKFILILFAFGGIISGVIWGINYLNNI